MGVLVPNHAETRIVMFTDLRDSTAQRVLLGDDAFDDLRRQHDRVLNAAVTRHRGCVVKSTGDGMHIAFGAASSAVSCATAMQRGIARLNQGQSASQRLSLAIGISAGDVVAEGGDVYGTSVVEAARLCATACGGQVLVTDVIRLLAGTRGAHEFEQRGDLTLRGLAAPVPISEVPWQATDVARVPLPAQLTPSVGDFVGRVAERELLLQSFKQSENRATQLVVVMGEPGIGKSRLVREAAVQMYEAGAVVLAGRCDARLGGPFQPWVGALAHLVAHLPHDVVAEHLAEHGAGVVTLVPDIGRHHLAASAPARREATDAAQHRLFEDIAALLRTAAADLPLVILLDDLQWADEPSLDLLRHLVRVAPPAPILLIVTCCDTDLHHSPLGETLADLRRDDLYSRILLLGLSEEDLDEFVAARLGRSAPSEFVHAVFVETDGNPFLAGEVLVDLVDTNATGDGDLERLSLAAVDRRRQRGTQPG